MNLLHCQYCDSNLVNLIAVRIKHDTNVERNIDIKNDYMNVKDPIAIKHYLRCYNCAKVSELTLKNCRGCTSIETSKHGEPQNEIINMKQRLF